MTKPGKSQLFSFKRLLHLPIIAIIIITLIALVPLFKSGFFLGLDGELHLGRIAAYAQALKAGHFPVRWADGLNYTFGYPIFNFIYPLPYLASAIFHLVGFSLTSSIKLTLSLALILSAIFMYQAIKLWQPKPTNWAAITASIVYALAPYRFLDTHLRVALGEAVAFIFPPLIISGFFLWYKHKQAQGWLMMVLASTLLILSHNVLALMFLAFTGVFCITQMLTSTKTKPLNTKPLLFLFTVAFSLALLSSAFFWLPALLELKYTLAQHFLFEKDFHNHFLSITNVIYKPLGDDQRYNLVYLGFESLAVILLYLITTIKRKAYTLTNLYLLTSLVISLLLITKWSVVIWESIPLMPFFQIPSRFLALTTLIIALLTVTAIHQSRQQRLLSILIITIFIIATITHYQVSKPAPIDESYFTNYPKSTTWHNEASPIWTAGETDHYPPAPFQIIGNGQLLTTEKQPQKHRLTIQAQEPLTLIDNTIFFPGWRATINSQPVDIQFQDPNHRGLITLAIPPGEHQVEISFTHTKIRLISELLSLTGILFTLIMISIPAMRRRLVGKH